ncbi:hypothetical protein [Acidovorax phage AP1]|nr:hypothetical protein [Acidovorax phage AP1]
MTRDQAADRQAFEQFMLQRNATTRLARQSYALGGHYRTTTVQRAWELWQAAVIHAFADPRIAELEAELAALKAPAPILSNSAELEPATPWYPDDSGEWVEVPEDLEAWPPGLDGSELIEVLMRGERDYKGWTPDSDLAPRWDWAHPPGHRSRIVAYKVVKP